jgi:hypothetical protein
MQKHSTNSSQVTVLGVNDETLGVIELGYVLMRLKTPYTVTKGEVLHRESYF